jgi:glucose/arabinose dehydrogenase
MLVAVTLLAALALGACSDEDGSPGVTVTATPAPGDSPRSGPADSSSSGGSSESGGSSTAAPDRPPGPARVVGAVARGLAVPWGLAFLPSGAAVVTERDTRRVLLVPPADGVEHRVREIGVVDEAAPVGEAGLLGVAVSPDFTRDHRLFLYLTTATDNRIVSTAYRAGRIGPLTVVLDGIPRGEIHDGGRLAFGPVGFLYASTGETGNRELAQDRDSLAGKILRITPAGDPAPGNPFPGSPVWSYGHRNVQGLAFDDRDRLWASEFGENTFDELNLIRPGGNYGWPLVEGRGGQQGLIDPQVVWRTDVASPSGLAFVDDHLWLASLRGERLWRIDVTGRRATAPTDFFVGRYGRMRTVALAPDGRLWVTTSNRDGRGFPAAADDRILLVDPG